MTKFFTQPVSQSASVVLLDTCSDFSPTGRVWNLVSGLDICGNTIYGVSYSETDICNWYSSLDEAVAIFEECRNTAVPF